MRPTNRKPDWRGQASSKCKKRESQCGWKRENNGAEKETRREKKKDLMTLRVVNEERKKENWGGTKRRYNGQKLLEMKQ